MAAVRLSLTLVVAACFMAAAHAAAEERDAPAPATAIAVVVGRHSFVTAVTKDELRELYLRRQRLWSNGTRTIPINLPAGDPVRERFTHTILGRSNDDLIAYWNARYFEGITPPTVLPSATAIRAYVKIEPAAIAYLPLPEVDASCRVLLVIDR